MSWCSGNNVLEFCLWATAPRTVRSGSLLPYRGNVLRAILGMDRGRSPFDPCPVRCNKHAKSLLYCSRTAVELTLSPLRHTSCCLLR
ncbi:hypothetical protein IG631_08031 [Alternaria alternata]|nr:hypothetical protein IG631_08031 [Alternaria alternata]